MLIWRLGLNEEPLAMIRLVSFCYRCASVTLLTSGYIMNEQNPISFGFSELFLLTRLQRFQQCLHRRFFIPV